MDLFFQGLLQRVAVSWGVNSSNALHGPGFGGRQARPKRAFPAAPRTGRGPPHVCAPAAHISISKRGRKGCCLGGQRSAVHSVNVGEEISPGVHGKEEKGMRVPSCVHHLPDATWYPPLPPKPHTVAQMQGDKNHFARIKALFPILALFISKSLS